MDEFSKIVRDYAPRMINLAQGIVRRRETAEDVVQEAFVKAFEKLGSWRGEGALSTWLYRIVYTTAVSHVRGQKNGRDFWEGAETLPDAADTDGGWELTEENIAKMERALDMLASLDRTLVNLFYIEDKSVRDIATITGRSEANVKTRLHRARVRLRELIEN